MSDDELPDLAVLLAPSASSTSTNRQSPRKVFRPQRFPIYHGSVPDVQTHSRKTRVSPRKPKHGNASPTKSDARKPVTISLGNVPVLSCNGFVEEQFASSSNSLARSPQQRSIGLTHVDSLLLPLSKVCLDGQAKQPALTSTGIAVPKPAGMKKPQVQNVFAPQNQAKRIAKASKFVVTEAACVDNSENSLLDDDDDDDTDLSGFIVDDDAELSVRDSSSDSEAEKRTKRRSLASPRRRRLQRRSKQRKQDESVSLESDFDKENAREDNLSNAFQDLDIGLKKRKSRKQETEIVDLTSSPVGTQLLSSQAKVNTENHFSRSIAPRKPGEPLKLFDEFDTILRFSPPRSSNPASLLAKIKSDPTMSDYAWVGDSETSTLYAKDGFTTPPTTPPRYPSKLKSPSKLLSPSKRATQVQSSPHRQSIDGFWDLEVVNTWHDTYSPKKEPLASPKKNRFLEWLDSEDEDDDTPTGLLNDSSNSLPSPCSSPRKSKSPLKSPEKLEKQRLIEEKRAARAKKQDFNSKKERIANALLQDLDTNITASKLSDLSTSTGGVQIIWSKTLRSTAGRANWRRTLMKPTGSPAKDSSVPEGSKVQHYASIELAAKVIDCESRLVNTLAHEFCHLANFMVSGVRDQPHGASFKAWAAKVTQYLRGHETSMYRAVEVTTKHSYAIEFKYLWVCAGRESSGMLKDVPVIEDGCGAEYGRHSKSIDTDKSRCGRCKGALVQVRPKPRQVDPKRSSPRKAPFQKSKSAVETVTEAVEFVDLSD